MVLFEKALFEIDRCAIILLVLDSGVYAALLFVGTTGSVIFARIGDYILLLTSSFPTGRRANACTAWPEHWPRS